MWTADDYFIDLDFKLDASRLQSLADLVYSRVLRIDFSQPGFSLIRFPAETDSFEVRHSMVALKKEFERKRIVENERQLSYLSVGRFDQQTTTRPHRDNAPAESLLMLGYEPTTVEATLSLFDFSKCAFDNEMTPEKWLTDHNPMYVAGEQLLQSYRTQLDLFDASRFQILLINNSIKPYDPSTGNLLGVLHTAEIKNTRPDEKRVVNSTMVGDFSLGTPNVVSEEQLQTFLTTSDVSERMFA